MRDRAKNTNYERSYKRIDEAPKESRRIRYGEDCMAITEWVRVVKKQRSEEM